MQIKGWFRHAMATQDTLFTDLGCCLLLQKVASPENCSRICCLVMLQKIATCNGNLGHTFQ